MDRLLRYTVLISSCLVSCYSNLAAQRVTNESKTFVVDYYLHHNKKSEKLLYSKGITEYKKSRLIEALNRNDTLTQWESVNGKFRAVDTLILTREEKGFIVAQLQMQEDHSLWNEIELRGSQEISQDTLKAIFNDRQRGWNYFHNTFGRSINAFSIPIFFRNNQYVAFYNETKCGGLCGGGDFSIYRKVNNRWVAWITLYDWVS